MKEVFEAIGVFLLAAVAVVFGGVVFVGMLAAPFIAIGLGLGAAGWTFCLFVNFC